MIEQPQEPGSSESDPSEPELSEPGSPPTVPSPSPISEPPMSPPPPTPPQPPIQPVGGPGSGTQPTAASVGVDYSSGGSKKDVSNRPEVVIAATFVGGLVLATILKRLAR